MFRLLSKRKVSSVFLRVLLFIYRNQTCIVKWNGVSSYAFHVKNGVRQGLISSAVFFILYIDEILALLKKSGFGCYVNSLFVGAFLFADDIFLMSANRSGLETMINICEKFASSKNLKFGTNAIAKKSKTKCIAFSLKPREISNRRQFVSTVMIFPGCKKSIILASLFNQIQK